MLNAADRPSSSTSISQPIQELLKSLQRMLGAPVRKDDPIAVAPEQSRSDFSQPPSHHRGGNRIRPNIELDDAPFFATYPEPRHLEEVTGCRRWFSEPAETFS